MRFTFDITLPKVKFSGKPSFSMESDGEKVELRKKCQDILSKAQEKLEKKEEDNE
jgi:hypothetical protein